MSPSSPAAFRRLAIAGAAAVAALIVFGGVVRITGSGMGCGDDWPLCNGRLIPPMDFPTAIEYGHRLAAAAVSVLVVVLLAVALLRHRSEPRLHRPAVLAAVLLASQVALGAITVRMETAAASVVLHFVNAMALLAVLVVAVERARPGARAPSPADAFTRTAWAAFAVGATAIFLGALVANLDAGLVCQGFPLCNGRLLPWADPLIRTHWAHRMVAYALVIVAVGVVRSARRHRSGDAAAGRAAWLVLLGVAGQVAVAAAMVLQLLPASLRALHLAVGTVLWIALVHLVYVGGGAIGRSGAGGGGLQQTAPDRP